MGEEGEVWRARKIRPPGWIPMGGLMGMCACNIGQVQKTLSRRWATPEPANKHAFMDVWCNPHHQPCKSFIMFRGLPTKKLANIAG